MNLDFLLPLFFQKLIWIPIRVLLIVFGRLKILGLENIKNIKVPIIFVCNHSSEIDPFMVPATLPFWSSFSPLFYIVREKDFYEDKGWRKQLFNSWFIRLWGGYGARVGIKDYGMALEKHIDLLQRGRSFCVFPEGYITRDGNIQEAKGGVSYLAHSSSCVIIPVAISNVYKMSILDFFTLKRNITISFGIPINPNDVYMKVQPHEPGRSLWKEEADYIMTKVKELLVR